MIATRIRATIVPIPKDPAPVTTRLIWYTQSYNISKDVLEENCKPEPFSGLHLMCHCGNSWQDTRIKQVEQQERECCYC